MIAAASALRSRCSSERPGLPRDVVLLAASIALDAVAAGIMLLGAPLPPSLGVPAAAAAHGAAAMVLCGLSRERSSRRSLCVAAVLAVPLAGAAVAVAIITTRGRRSTGIARRRKAHRRPALTIAAVHRLGCALSPSDALGHGDAEQRRSALVALSRRDDPEAIALLRRTAAGRDPDLALSAALVLDEIGERAERRADRPVPVERRHAAS